MKSRIFIVAAVLFLSTVFSPARVKAFGWFPPPPPKQPVRPPVTLPINNGADLLIIAGILIGVVVLKKSNPAIKANI
jgi:hypothetical protein